jgi:hypothetical protein
MPASTRRDLTVWGSGATTPLLGRFMLDATWANVGEHAAGPCNYWGSRGRGFKSRRPGRARFGQFSGADLMRFVIVTVK